MTPIELATLITAIGGILIAIATNRSSATKAELESLRATIVTLSGENDRLKDRVRELEAENESLRCEIGKMWENVNARRRQA